MYIYIWSPLSTECPPLGVVEVGDIPVLGPPGGLVMGYTAFQGQLKVATWNAQGLFCSDLARCRRKINLLRHLLRAVDCLLVQEAHCCRGRAEGIEKEFQSSQSFFWDSPDNILVGGIGIIMTKKFMAQFASVEFSGLVQAHWHRAGSRGASRRSGSSP